MGGKNFLLDTNIVIALFKKEQNVRTKVESAENFFLPVIVLGELYYGVELSSNKKENTQRLENFADEVTTIILTKQTAGFYSKIKALLKLRGNPIPDNDIWIAAIAEENDLPLVTRDKHFDLIKSIKVIKW